MNDVIDASGNIDKSEEERDRDNQDRGPANLDDTRRQRTAGSKVLFLAVVVCGLLLVCFLVWQAMQNKQDASQAAEAKEPATMAAPMHPLNMDAADVTPTPEPAKEPAAPIKPEPSTASAGTGEPPKPSPAELLRQRRLGSPLEGQGTAGSGASQGNAAATPAGQPRPPAYASAMGGAGGSGLGAGQQSQDQNLETMLEPVHLKAESAGRIGSQNFMLLQGTVIPCVLVPRIDSGLPGMLSCDVTRDIYSANGHTVLLDRGTRITGNYQHGLQQGQERLFVLWQRAVTPEGVIINLDSPAADQLGAAGVGGKVNNHFWKRFGAAILLSVIDDASQYEIAKQQRGSGGNAYVFGSTNQAVEDLANTTLKHTINIPPTLMVRHGSRISIFVARDLDFSSIYGLKPVASLGGN